jgi:hypothetical protein
MSTGKPAASFPTSAELSLAGLVHDPSVTGFDRYTHRVTQRAVVRAAWMSDIEWALAVHKFIQQVNLPHAASNKSNAGRSPGGNSPRPMGSPKS